MRILCLGNELLGDDGIGPLAAERLRETLPAGVEIVSTSESGLDLLEHLQHAGAVVVVDAVQTGAAAPGTVHIWNARELAVPQGPSPHYAGLNETLALARALDLALPPEITVLAIEAGDTLSFGAEMTPEVRDAIPLVAGIIEKMLARPD